METETGTAGYASGFENGGAARAERCAAPLVQVRGDENTRMAPNKEARPKRQLRTGASYCDRQLTREIISRMPRLRRWGLYTALALLMTGVAPMALASCLARLCEAAGWWLLVPVYAAVGFAARRVMLP